MSRIKKVVSLSALLLVFGVGISALSADAQGEAPILLSPNGGEYWTKGTPQTIKWNVGDSSKYANVTLWAREQCDFEGTNCTQVNSPIAMNTPNDGEFLWDIGTVALGENLKADKKYKLSIGVAGGVVDFDKSDGLFSIVDTSTGYRVISPNGGETWKIGFGNTKTISWEMWGFI